MHIHSLNPSSPFANGTAFAIIKGLAPPWADGVILTTGDLDSFEDRVRVLVAEKTVTVDIPGDKFGADGSVNFRVTYLQLRRL
tara:strand:+ start:154 stop:402 length:249 start_codon:yes stop_codon:yes gene_type:complete